MTPTGPPAYVPFNTPPQEEIDHEHLRMLELGYLIAGILEIIFSSFFIGHIVIGILTITHKIPSPPSSGFPIPFGYFFLVGGSIIVLGGWTLGILTLIGRRFLRQRRHYIFLLVLAGISCVIATPVGTALGIFTFILLFRPSISALFRTPSTPARSWDS
jgi:hypothetical protein